MRTDECLLQEMSVLLRKSDFSIFEEYFFLSSSVSPTEPWISVLVPERLYLLTSEQNLAWCLPLDIYWISPGAACCLLSKHTLIILCMSQTCLQAYLCYKRSFHYG